MPSRRVLIMDDDSSVLEVATAMLEHLGYEAATCTRGEEAIELYRLSRDQSVPFKAVILDLKVPRGLGGIDTAKAILALNPRARLVVSSGYCDEPPICQLLFEKSLPKPYSVGDMESVLASL